VSSIAQPHFTQNHQEPTRCCDVCELDVPSLTSWYGVSLCADCLDLQATRTAHGDCVCVTCLQHQHDHTEERP
jgi:hypothetical protein